MTTEEMLVALQSRFSAHIGKDFVELLVFIFDGSLFDTMGHFTAWEKLIIDLTQISLKTKAESKPSPTRYSVVAESQIPVIQGVYVL